MYTLQTILNNQQLSVQQLHKYTFGKAGHNLINLFPWLKRISTTKNLFNMATHSSAQDYMTRGKKDSQTRRQALISFASTCFMKDTG